MADPDSKLALYYRFTASLSPASMESLFSRYIKAEREGANTGISSSHLVMTVRDRLKAERGQLGHCLFFSRKNSPSFGDTFSNFIHNEQ